MRYTRNHSTEEEIAKGGLDVTTFAVYEHKVFGKKSVKNGFSAGGFFFPIIWALINKIWWLAAVLFPWGMFATLMDRALSNNGGDAFGAFLAQFIFYHLPAGLIFGFSGNGLLRSSLEKQGYAKLLDIEALSPEDALAKTASQAPASAPTSSDKGQSDLAAQISRLNDLRQQGALSDAEYQSAKERLLA